MKPKPKKPKSQLVHLGFKVTKTMSDDINIKVEEKKRAQPQLPYTSSDFVREALADKLYPKQ